MDASCRRRRAAWIAVALLWVVALLNYLDRQLIVTMGQPIKTDLAIGDAQFGLFSSAFLWVYAFCSPAAGYLADRYGRRRVILFSLLVWSIATLGTGLAANFAWVLAARAVMGISEAFYVPAAVALIVDFHRGRTRSLATGLHLSGMYVGSILGGLGGWMAESFGWRLGFQAFGGIGVGYALFLAAFLKNPPPPDSEELAGEELAGEEPADVQPEKPRLAETFRSLLGDRSFWFLLAADACVGAGFWTIKNWMPTFFNLELGVDLTRAGLYSVAAFNAAAFVGMLAAGVLSDRLAVRNLRVRTLLPAVGFCIAAPFLFGVGVCTATPFVCTAVLALGMSQGCLDSNLMPALCTIAPARHRATGYGLLNCVSTLTGGCMTFVGGWLRDAHVSLSETFLFAAGFVLLAGLLLFPVKPQMVGKLPNRRTQST